MPREILSLDPDWRFHRGDLPFPKLVSHSDCYGHAKAGAARGAASPAFDDSTWPLVHLPHDLAVEEPFIETESLSQGFRPRGLGWYRRHFRLDPADRGRHLELRFDGAASHCTVWLNGNLVHRNHCGYTGWTVDLTPFARYGEEPNTLAIRVDAETMEGWWYEGAGLYRHTWLVKRDRTHVITDGIFANPVRDASGNWSVPVAVTVGNTGRQTETVDLLVLLLDPRGHELTRSSTSLNVGVLSEASAQLPLAVADPQLWHVDTPVLYTVRTLVCRNGEVVDQVDTRCGFRTLRFTPDEGFFLNDRPLKLQGVCCHQDHAGVGVALPDALWAWRLRQLKSIGVNAYRVAHNPPSTEFLDLCDQLGILVMDENRHFNCAHEYVGQLEWLVRRDRNHPCVFLWSVFNEEPMQGSEIGVEMVRRLVAVVKRLDPTRPVTAAMNGGLFSPINVSQAVDVVGFNYQIEFYDRFHEANPHLCLTSSEDTSAFMTRGAYERDPARHIIGSLDTEAAPWGATHRDAWRAIAERQYLAGGFVWTGFDYHGEPTPHAWPTNSSFFGIFDLCGFPKLAAHIHHAHWTPRDQETVLELAPHWNWEGREGQLIRVLAVTNAPSAALSLNGQTLGQRAVDRFDFASWEVPYQPGRLEVIALDEAGRELARRHVDTTGEPTSLELIPDRTGLLGDGVDCQPITVRALDAQGRPVPTANIAVRFELTGPGTIIGLGNGDPNCHESEKGHERSLFNGLAQIIVQSAPGSAGPLAVRAIAPGLNAGELRLQIDAAPQPAIQPAVEPVLYLQNWRMSPVADTRLDPNVKVADNDMNTWPGIQPGELQSFVAGAFALYRIVFTPFVSHQREGARIAFAQITGEAEIWLNGTRLDVKSDPAPAPYSVPLAPGQGPRELTVLLRTQRGVPAGLSGPVAIT